MAIELFVLTVGLFLAAIFYWGFRNLPAENWQIMAAVPLKKDPGNNWQGLNLTYYGFFNATACVFACSMVMFLLTASHVSRTATAIVIALLLLIGLPSAKFVARLVEGKKHTLTIGGASFVCMIILPGLIKVVNASLGQKFGFVPTLPALAAVAIAYAFGEAIGRLACISFGCCYGRGISHWPNSLQQRARPFCFVFNGSTKKVAYEGKLAGTPVVPIQAVTSIVFGLAGLAGTLLLLRSHWVAAVLVSVGTTQLWRAVSEVFRADYRGGGKISAYQVMSVTAIVYTFGVIVLLGKSEFEEPQLLDGLRSFASGWTVIVLQLVWLLVFWYLGRSSVTRSTLQFEVVRDRV